MLNCPLGLIAGTIGNATLSDCDGAIGWSSSDPNLVVTPRPNGEARLTALSTASGTATITATCDGVPFTCEVNLISTADAENLVCRTTPPLTVGFDTCGEICDCVSYRFTVIDCGESDVCNTAYVTVDVRDCAQPEPEVCPPSTNIKLQAN